MDRRRKRKECTELTESEKYLYKLIEAENRRLKIENDLLNYVVGNSNNNQLVFDTLDLAVSANPTAKPLFYSDRGFQYTNRIFKVKLDKIKATQSMSPVSRYIDNGPMEGFGQP